MAQITTASLMEAFQKLEERVLKIETQMKLSDAAIERVDTRLARIETMFESIKRFALWGLASPIITGAVIVILQHWLHV